MTRIHRWKRMMSTSWRRRVRLVYATHPPTHTHFLRVGCSSHLRLARSIIAPRIADHLIGSQNAVNLWADLKLF